VCGDPWLRLGRQVAGEHAMSNTILQPFQPDSMTRAQLAAVSYLARYSGHTHSLYAYQLRRWFEWCETNRLDPLDRIQRAHVELYIRQLGGSGLMPSSINTMMHGVRGFFRFAHIDGLIPSDPRSTPCCRRSTPTSPAPKDWTVSS
jgi:integrase/recombinase XerD